MLKAAVDHSRCQGHARCWQICPEIFNLDSEGHVELLMQQVPEELSDRAREAALNCPEGAITVS